MMKMRAAVLAASVASGLVFASVSEASFIGTSVTGSLQFNGGGPNYYDPANGFVPAGYLNTASPTVVVAEPAIEFGFADGANAITTNVTASQVLVIDQFLSTAGVSPITITLTDAAFVGLGASVVTETFVGTPTASISGNTLTINIPGVGSSAPGTLALALFDIAAVPEPASALALGSLAVLGLRRRRA